MQNEIPFIKDMQMAIFQPSLMFSSRFLAMPRQRIERLGFICVFLALLVGNLITYGLSSLAASQYVLNPAAYTEAFNTLGIDPSSFLDLIGVQKAYALLLVVFSPVIAFMAPHLFGGALFAFLWIFLPHERSKFDFYRIMDLASVAMCSLSFYIIPLIGPLIAVILIAVNCSRALKAVYGLSGLTQVSAVILSVYIFFFLGATSLQLLAYPFAEHFKS